MSVQNRQLYFQLCVIEKDKKLRWWKDRHIRKLKRMLEYRKNREMLYMPLYDRQIELQKTLCGIKRRRHFIRKENK
jgi:hypothetical protein